MWVVPWSLVALRLLLGPAVVVAARCSVGGGWLAGAVVVALATDVFDGVLARRWGCATAAIRLADSLVDTAFYLGVLAAMWVRAPGVVAGAGPLLLALIGLEVVRHGFDAAKFGRAASYHSYLAKAWGLVMAVAVTVVLATDGRHGGMAFGVSLVLGILSDVEGLAMSILLPVWRADVKTVGRAVALRREHRAAAGRA